MNLLVIDPERREVRYANAGMPAPLLFRRGASLPEYLRASGIFVGGGYSKYSVFPEQATVAYSDGDILMVVSDGIIEARNHAGALFGESGVQGALLTTRSQDPGEIVAALLRAVESHSTHPHPEDDQTVVVIRLGSPTGGDDTVSPPLIRKLDGPQIRFEISNADGVIEAVDQTLRPAFAELARSHGYNDSATMQLWQAVWEVLVNAIRHGSVRGDDLGVEFLANPGDRLVLEVRQPRAWPGWDEVLGVIQRTGTADGDEAMDSRKPSGARVILNVTQKVQASDLGRTLKIVFPGSMEFRGTRR